jgi:hypothetical protein
MALRMDRGCGTARGTSVQVIAGINRSVLHDSGKESVSPVYPTGKRCQLLRNAAL